MNIREVLDIGALLLDAETENFSLETQVLTFKAHRRS